jgi:hypothetical protein
MKLHLLFLVLIILICSCKEKTTEVNGLNTVKGTVTHQQKPVANATVSLKGQSNLSSQTDPSGKFTILDVPNGNYTISAEKINSDSSILATTSYVTVTGDMDLQTLILPKGVKMYSVTIFTSSTISLSWNPTDASDFREYKLYRHTTSGLDETTGTLAHVSTTINDTSFVDENLNPLTKYFYRVYVMNDYGRLGGSDIVSSTTSNMNYIQNGGFEINDLMNWWDTTKSSWGQVVITDSISKVGKKCLLLISKPFSEYGISGVRSRLFSGSMKIPDGNYKLSFWVKVEGIPNSVSSYDWYSFSGSDNYLAGIANDNQFPIGVKIGDNNLSEWTYVEKQIRIPSYYYSIWGYYFEIRSYCQKAWFDDIKLEIVQ